MAASRTADRIVLVGAPSRLSGVVRMSNPGSDKLKIKSAPLQLKSLQSDALQLALGLRLPPGGSAHAPVSLQLDPRTPPGEIHGQVMLGGQAREVVVKVLEHRELAIQPGSFHIHGAAGARVEVPAVLTNLGNVPFELPKVALVAMSQAQGFEQMFHVAMARAGEKGHQAALDLFAQLLGASEVDPPKVVFGAGAGRPLAPGDSLETQLRFELPANLARHRLYAGSFSIGRLQCEVEIEVDDPVAATPAPPEPKPTPPRKRRP